MNEIHFFNEQTNFKLNNSDVLIVWIVEVAKNENKKIGALNFIFCTDEYLLQLNIKYLDHRTLTDILTFDQSEVSYEIAGDIYISVDRVKENALVYNVSMDTELCRVMIHGVLHLIGYQDGGKSQKEEIKKKEEAYLSLLESLMFHVKH